MDCVANIRLVNPHPERFCRNELLNLIGFEFILNGELMLIPFCIGIIVGFLTCEKISMP